MLMAARLEVADRLEKVRNLMIEKELDVVILRKRRSFSWLTGGRANDIVQTVEEGVADLVIFPERAVCVTTQMEAARIREEELDGLGFEFVTLEWTEGTEQALAALCEGRRVGADVLPAALGLDHGVYIGQALARLAYVLTPPEQDRYRELCQMAAQAVESTCREIEPGMTEYEIAAHAASKVIAFGAWIQVLLVAADERIYNYRHPIPTDKKLQRYAMLVLCAEKWGLVANVTRFVHFGPLPKEVAENRFKLARIDAVMNHATRPGVPIREVFQKGIEAYEQAGYPEDWRYLHQGGPTGYASREFLATLESEGDVQLYQAFAWNPSIRGIKSEDTILVKQDSNEFLTYTGDWPALRVELDSRWYHRPDILIR
jgi:Xaa-Pro dipeptidase